MAESTTKVDNPTAEERAAEATQPAQTPPSEDIEGKNVKGPDGEITNYLKGLRLHLITTASASP